MSKQTNERRMREWALLLETSQTFLNGPRLVNELEQKEREEQSRKDIRAATCAICGYLLRGEKVPSCRKYIESQIKRAETADDIAGWLGNPLPAEFRKRT